MASDASFVDYVCDQMRAAGSISSRKMFGEYAVYCDGKVVALICDDQLYVKPTEGGRILIGAAVEAPPYPGAKPHFLVTDRVDDREWLGALIAATVTELPHQGPAHPRAGRRPSRISEAAPAGAGASVLHKARATQRRVDIDIRDETGADIDAIEAVTVAAFETLDISDHTEQHMIAALRAAGALTVSLVAVVDGRVVGHVAFSAVSASDGTPDWYGLGPVSVLPEYQRQGVGSALIREGLARLEAMNARGCCVVGHPGYYGRFGFENTAELGHEGVPPEAFFVLPFDGKSPRGTVSFHEAFGAVGP